MKFAGAPLIRGHFGMASRLRSSSRLSSVCVSYTSHINLAPGDGFGSSGSFEIVSGYPAGCFVVLRRRLI